MYCASDSLLWVNLNLDPFKPVPNAALAASLRPVSLQR